jgi:hypothetical protein
MDGDIVPASGPTKPCEMGYGARPEEKAFPVVRSVLSVDKDADRAAPEPERPGRLSQRGARLGGVNPAGQRDPKSALPEEEPPRLRPEDDILGNPVKINRRRDKKATTTAALAGRQEGIRRVQGHFLIH